MAKRMGVFKEFCLFLRERKAYWLSPIILVLLLLIFFVVLAPAGITPFIYPLF